MCNTVNMNSINVLKFPYTTSIFEQFLIVVILVV